MADVGTVHSDLAVRLLRAAAEQPSLAQEEAAMIDLALGGVLLARTAGQRGPAADEGMKYLTTAFEKAPVGSTVRVTIAQNLCSVLVARFFTVGNRQDLQAAQFYLDVFEEARSMGPSGPLAMPMAEVDLMIAAARGLLALAHGQADGNRVAARAATEHLRAAVRMAGPRHPLAGRMRSDLGLALLLNFHYSGEDPADLQEGVAELEAAAALLSDDHPMRDMALFRVAASLFLLGTTRQDPRALRAGIERMRQVRANWRGGIGDPHRATALLALLHRGLWELSDDPADLAAAREWYATAAAEFDQQPGHPQHGNVLIGLAQLERRAGKPRAAVRAALAALRSSARDVLLQADPVHGLAAARATTAAAVEVAGWCLAYEPAALADGAALAIEVLELSRGLVLHSATRAADLPELLGAAGRADLADEWRRLAGQAPDDPWDGSDPARSSGLLSAQSLAVPSDLRERTLAALDSDDLVTPPTWREIAGALTRIGSDALVYLLPPDDGGPGCAVLVPASGGEPRAVPLPELRQETSGKLEEFAAAQASLLADPATVVARTDAAGEPGGQPGPDGGPRQPDYGAAEGEWRSTLGPLCEWAWTTVIGPLLEAVPRAAPDVPPRLVLVPVGQARHGPVARRPPPGPRRRVAVRRRRRRVLLRGLWPPARGGQPPPCPPADERPRHRGTGGRPQVRPGRGGGDPPPLPGQPVSGLRC